MRAILSAGLGLALLASSANAMEAVQRVEREVVVTQADGSQTVQRLAADEVTPGETIIYTLDYVNTQSDAVSDLVLAMPVPDEIVFDEGSADRAGARVEYSADGGQTFSDRLALMVRMEGGATRSAGSEDITTVRWTLSEAVQPGERGEVTFRGRLR